MCRHCNVKAILAGGQANLSLMDKIQLNQTPDTIIVLEEEVANDVMEIAEMTKRTGLLPDRISNRLLSDADDVIYDGRKALREELKAYLN